MAAEGFAAVKSRAGLTVRPIGVAKGREVGVGVGDGAESLVEGDGAVHAAAGFGEVAELAGVAAEVELDGGVGGVLRFSDAEDFLGGGEIFRAADGVGPGDPAGGFAGCATDELDAGVAEGGPVLLLLENGDVEGEGGRGVALGEREMLELSGGFRDHAEAEIALDVGEAPFGLHRGAVKRAAGRL